MVDKAIDIKTLNLEELTGVVSLYPWYGGARKELCRRMAALGDGAWAEERFADMALYIGSRRLIAELARKSHEGDYADSDVENLLKSYFDDGSAAEAEAPVAEAVETAPKAETKDAEAPAQPQRQIFVVGGDYFSRSQYENVRKSEDNIFSSFAKGTGEATGAESTEAEDLSDYFTETLAEVYLEQGYPEQAKHIYSQLILRYPEKSVYFAALIDKIDN